jgi:ubiquinone/menaquinone biosynthesis C-methylase UbiE
MNIKVKSSIPQIFDRKKIRPNQIIVNNLFNKIASEIALRLKETNLSFENALEINSKTLETSIKIQDTRLIKNLYKTAIINTKNKNILNFICDEEYLAIRNNSLDLIYSILGLNTINDLPGSLKQIYNCLKPKGLFIATFWGEGTLMPLAESLAYADEKILGGLYPRIFPYCDIKTLGSLMQRAGFSLPMADQEKIIKKYTNLEYLMKDIRSFNEKNILCARSKKFTPRTVFKEAEVYLMKNYKKQSTFSIPFNIIFVMGWKD